MAQQLDWQVWFTQQAPPPPHCESLQHWSLSQAPVMVLQHIPLPQAASLLQGQAPHWCVLALQHWPAVQSALLLQQFD